ncbi:sigma-70 family RNA polymerase sigma factor [Novipirellula sp. SH528]|uniref:sigma-70 family RNA polymerase sigma factor n=1 Tax=Novipirellula sp. SH528 TaxID=3454466 RepID=UPI003FA0F66B
MNENPSNYETFMRLLIEEESAVKAYVRRLVPTWHDVEEVVQQTSLIAWKKFDELDDINRFGGWLMTIARFESLKYRRSLALSPLVFSDKLAEQLADAAGNIVADDADRQQALEGCLQKLDQAKRELILDVHHPGVTIRGYAQQHSRPEQAIYKAVHRLRQQLLMCVKQTLADQVLS